MTLLKRSAPSLAVMTAAVAATAVACGGSTTTGSLFVAVIDVAGAPVVNATVSTMPPSQALVTDALGTAFFPKLATGGYAVTAAHPSAGAGRQTAVVKANDVAHVTIALSPGIVLPPSGGGGMGGASGRGGAPGAGGHAGGGTPDFGGSNGTGASGGRPATGGVGGATSGPGGASGAIVLGPLTKDTNGVNLSWTVAAPSSFATFRIYRSSAVIDILQSGAAVQYRDETGQLGVSYTYQVGGVTATGQEVRSNSQTITSGIYIDVGSQIEGMMADPKRAYLYGIDKVNNSLHFINLTTNTVEKSIFVGSSPTDLDINLKGTTLYIANFGSTQISMIDLDMRVMAGSIFVDTTVGTWDGNPYRLACLAGDTLVFTSMDQWNDLKLVDALTGAALDHQASVYEPDLVASPDGTHLYVGEYIGPEGLHRFDVVGNKLQQIDVSSQAGVAHVLASRDGKYVYYGAQKILTTNLKSIVGTYPETVLAITSDGSIAVGEHNIMDGNSLAVKRATPLSTTKMAISPDDSTLYLYDTMSSRIYLYRLK